MELRHLQYFVAAAEELHFSRAAQRLGISQPALSKQVAHLERELGTPLFHRLARGLELTEVGKSFLEDARVILDHVDRAKLDVERQARGERGRLLLGFGGATHFVPLLPAIVLEYRRKYPDVVLSPSQNGSNQLIGQLRSGEIDIAFMRPPAGPEPGLTLDPVAEEEMVICLPRAHRLAGLPSLPLAALAKEPLILPRRDLSPPYHDSVTAACRTAGFTPILGQEASQIVAAVSMVGAGFGISLVPRSASYIRLPQVAYVSILGPPIMTAIAMGHRRGDPSPLVRNFVTLARRRVREGLPAGPAAEVS